MGSINQVDVSERSRQVDRMGQIFGAAEEVIVWLGLPTKDSYDAMSDILKFHQDALNISSNPWEASDRLKSLEPTIKEIFTRSVADICERPYWSRLWIIQEVIVAVKIKVQCGTVSMDWEELANGLRNMAPFAADKTIDSGPGLDRILQLEWMRETYHQMGCGLVKLLETFPGSNCSDTRDKLYGLLGIANDCGDGTFLADYRKSSSDIFYDVINFYYFQRLEQEATVLNDYSRGLMEFAQMLRRLLNLGGDSYEEVPEDLKYYNQSREILDIEGFFTGCVAAVGPFLYEIEKYPPLRYDLISEWHDLVRSKEEKRKKSWSRSSI